MSYQNRTGIHRVISLLNLRYVVRVTNQLIHYNFIIFYNNRKKFKKLENDCLFCMFTLGVLIVCLCGRQLPNNFPK